MSGGIIGGFRSFWGRKLGRTIASGLDNLSPIALARGEGLRKIQSTDGSIGAVFEAAAGHIGASRKTFGRGYTLGDYFTGLNYGDAVEGGRSFIRKGLKSPKNPFLPEQLGNRVRAHRMAWRLGLPGAAVGGWGASAVMGDNFVSDTIGFSAKAGTIAAGTSMLSHFGGRAGAFAALGILGWSGLNMLRSGDNFGPF